MSRTGWKLFERVVARKFFGTERIGPTGENGPDCMTDLFSVECRERATITYSDLEAWMAEVRSEAGHRVPVLAVRRCRGRGHKAAPILFIVDEQGWLDLHGPDTKSGS